MVAAPPDLAFSHLALGAWSDARWATMPDSRIFP